ncbi:MAG: hypothetical protein OEV94_00305 [Deltaproteobacteria bacterium]|nr:hypothetical protein [Deltaproteobacteria bacterium]
MARKIQSADNLLMPQAQRSLESTSVRTEVPRSVMQMISQRWSSPLPASPSQLLFDWNNREALEDEIRFVNTAQAYLEEGAVKIAPSVLRIVLTVKANLADPADQRAFLADQLEMDFRRASELCILAESYALLDPHHRMDGMREIETYGWSKALKLSAVRDPRERADIWKRAKGRDDSASYRAVLEELRRFRERKLLPPAPPEPAKEGVQSLWNKTRGSLDVLNVAVTHLESKKECKSALDNLSRLQQELNQIKKAIQEKMKEL